MNRRREIASSPPADFPVYGLDASWSGSRWLESFGDAIGDPVRWVSLGHRGRDGKSLIFVVTFSSRRTAARLAPGELPLQDVAFRAATVLINITLPEPSLPLPDGMLRALADHAHDRSSEYATWPLARLRVNAGDVTAGVWRFAGGWAAVSSDVPEVDLAVMGIGTDPGDLSLAALHDGGAYHFGLDLPLHPRVMSASRAARAGGDVSSPPRLGWHADQLRLLRDQAQSAE